uniref:Uncharacterized protein n=1 Tax=Glossina palpalis gambiensis TaxID=67801 RepID=A0A1B0BC12_9MUSC
MNKSLTDELMEKQRNLQMLLEKSLADEINIECILENKLGKVNQRSDQLGNLDILCKSGYCITECVENEINYVKISCKYFYVIFVKDQSKHEVEEIYPNHSNFRNIKQFLSDTQDLKGMLSYLREYFLDNDLKMNKSLTDELMEKQRNLQMLLEKSLADEINIECILENKLGKVNQRSDQLGNLDILCKSGYCITECVENEINYVKISCKYFYVIFVKDQSKHEVEEIYPNHSNFRNIKQFLSDTQDLKGMLSYLREYFLDNDLVNRSQSDRIASNTT